MSRWTHVAGTIRIDGMPGNDFIWMEELKKKLGIIVEFDSPEEIWNLNEEKITPLGSEGEIEYFLKVTGDEYSMSRGVVCIYGDLRDFGGTEDTRRIFNWLNRVFHTQILDNCFVRQGIIQIEDERQEGNALIIWRGEKFEILFGDYDTVTEF